MVRRHALMPHAPLRLALVLWALLLAGAARAQSPAPIAYPPDTTHWTLEGRASVQQAMGRACIFTDGGAAVLNNVDFRDGVLDVDVATTAAVKRGFFGFLVRVDSLGSFGEEIYLRTHESGQADAMQYTPVLNTGRDWQLYNGPGFTGFVDIPRDEWFHLRLVMTGAQAKLYVKDMEKPALVMDDLKSGARSGQIALYSLTGATYFSNFTLQKTADAPWQHHLPPMAPGAIKKWSLSPSYDALQRDLERPLLKSEADTMKWQNVEAEPPGLVPINRYRLSPHPRVSFQDDFSKRLEPQPGMRVVYARTTIESDRDQVKRLMIGYSDDVSVFLNGRILWRGRSAQAFRDPRFLGIVNPENDTVYLPLRKGTNELVLAVSELGGGWGYICRLADAAP